MSVSRSDESDTVNASSVMDHDGDFTHLVILASVSNETASVSDVINFDADETLDLQRGEGAELVHLYRHQHVVPAGGSTGGSNVIGEAELHHKHIDHNTDDIIGNDTHWGDSFEEGNFTAADVDLGAELHPSLLDYTAADVDEGAGALVNQRDHNFREAYGFGPVVDWEGTIGLRFQMNGNDNSEHQVVYRLAYLPMTIERIDEDFRFRGAIR